MYNEASLTGALRSVRGARALITTAETLISTLTNYNKPKNGPKTVQYLFKYVITSLSITRTLH